MLFNKDDVAGSVILYNSEMHVIGNIYSYLSQINHLFVIDNSEKVNPEMHQLISSLPHITYVANGDNMGIAYALNQAADLAITAGYKFLLTMDDDTSLPTGAVQTMLTYANQHRSEKLAIIAGQSDSRLFENTVKSVPYTITSGNLLNLDAYKDCGPFMNELFIDFVDHEYCFRLIKNNYKVVEINYINLVHKLGTKKQLILFRRKLPIYWISHNPLRIYYKIRNCIYALRKYDFVENSVRYIFCKEIFKDLLKILFLENNKKKRLMFFIEAINDAFNKNLGKR